MPNGISEREAAGYLMTMLSALSHCHEQAVVHRDVKLDNFVYVSNSNEAELKLIDFGLSHLGKSGEEISAKGRVGTLSYMAPEVLRRQPYAKPCDMWSLGVVAFILLAGRRPFHSRDRETKIDLILHSEPSYTGSGWRGISPTAIDFVKALLHKAPEERLTAAEALRHPWIAGAKAAAAADAAQQLQKNAQVVRSLQAFSTTSRLHKVALELLAFAAPSHEVDQLRQLFVAIDADGSGSISRDEFKSAMAAHPQFKDAELSRLFDQADFGGQGELSYNEFLAATLGAASGPPDEDKVHTARAAHRSHSSATDLALLSLASVTLAWPCWDLAVILRRCAPFSSTWTPTATVLSRATICCARLARRSTSRRSTVCSRSLAARRGGSFSPTCCALCRRRGAAHAPPACASPPSSAPPRCARRASR